MYTKFDLDTDYDLRTHFNLLSTLIVVFLLVRYYYLQDSYSEFYCNSLFYL
jgi:hypothetical protein